MVRLALVLAMLLAACDEELESEELLPECEPGSMRCIDDHQRQVCTDDATWATAPACLSNVCAEGVCDGICASSSQSCLAAQQGAHWPSSS